MRKVEYILERKKNSGLLTDPNSGQLSEEELNTASGGVSTSFEIVCHTCAKTLSWAISHEEALWIKKAHQGQYPAHRVEIRQKT